MPPPPSPPDAATQNTPPWDAEASVRCIDMARAYLARSGVEDEVLIGGTQAARGPRCHHGR
jgi:hypothetical protein